MLAGLRAKPPAEIADAAERVALQLGVRNDLVIDPHVALFGEAAAVVDRHRIRHAVYRRLQVRDGHRVDEHDLRADRVLDGFRVQHTTLDVEQFRHGFGHDVRVQFVNGRAGVDPAPVGLVLLRRLVLQRRERIRVIGFAAAAGGREINQLVFDPRKTAFGRPIQWVGAVRIQVLPARAGFRPGVIIFDRNFFSARVQRLAIQVQRQSSADRIERVHAHFIHIAIDFALAVFIRTDMPLGVHGVRQFARRPMQKARRSAGKAACDKIVQPDKVIEAPTREPQVRAGLTVGVDVLMQVRLFDPAQVAVLLALLDDGDLADALFAIGGIVDQRGVCRGGGSDDRLGVARVGHGGGIADRRRIPAAAMRRVHADDGDHFRPLRVRTADAFRLLQIQIIADAKDVAEAPDVDVRRVGLGHLGVAGLNRSRIAVQEVRDQQMLAVHVALVVVIDPFDLIGIVLVIDLDDAGHIVVRAVRNRHAAQRNASAVVQVARGRGDAAAALRALQFVEFPRTVRALLFRSVIEAFAFAGDESVGRKVARVGDGDFVDGGAQHEIRLGLGWIFDTRLGLRLHRQIIA